MAPLVKIERAAAIPRGAVGKAANVRGLLIPFMQEAGFTEVAETHRAMTPLGTLSLYRAIAPA